MTTARIAFYLTFCLAALSPACAEPDGDAPPEGADAADPGAQPPTFVAEPTSLAALCQGLPCPPLQLFAPGVISRPDTFEWRLTFSPDGKTALWAVTDEDYFLTRRSRLRLSRFVGGAWTEPVVPSFAVEGDFDPFFAPDGRTLFFSSTRAGGASSATTDIWSVAVEGDGWGVPKHLGTELNSPADELYPSVDRDGNLYFGSDRGGTPGFSFDLWRARRRADGSYGAPERLGAGVNTVDLLEFNPEISPDGRVLFFASFGRADSRGATDLYVSVRFGNQFLPAQNLGPCVNTADAEFHPTIGPDRRSLYFARQGEATTDFYRIALP